MLMLDSDEAGRVAAEQIAARLRQASIETRTVEVPAKDVAEYIVQGGAPDQLRALIARAAIESAEQESTPTLKMKDAGDDGAIVFSAGGRVAGSIGFEGSHQLGFIG